MRKLYLVLGLVALGVGVSMLILAPPPVQAKAPGDAPSTSAGSSQEAAQIICSFECADGYGYGYFCPDDTFGECCAAGGPACSNHGGLDYGVCSRGSLGMPCGGI